MVESRLILVMTSCFEILANFLMCVFFSHWGEIQENCILVPNSQLLRVVVSHLQNSQKVDYDNQIFIELTNDIY